ncbi:MAG: hypothetical protein OXF02_03325 [Simkaniaceae bacterium]|nr:hypothetical protein [Simkaniaceae bacterium]
MALKEDDISVEVAEIYPNYNRPLPNRVKEQGSCHVVLTVGPVTMEIKNIRYRIRRQGSIWIGPPVNMYPDPTGEKEKISVPTITFQDPAVFERIREAIRRDLVKVVN